MISTYIYTWFIVCFGHLYFVWGFGTTSIELQKIICDTAFWDSKLISMIRFVQFLYDHTFTLIKSIFERIGHLYDIELWDWKVVQII